MLFKQFLLGGLGPRGQLERLGVLGWVLQGWGVPTRWSRAPAPIQVLFQGCSQQGQAFFLKERLETLVWFIQVVNLVLKIFLNKAGW